MRETDRPKLVIRKGDTENFTLVFTGDDVPDDTVVALFTVKKSVDSPEPVIEKLIPISEGKCEIRLSTADTNIPDGKYVWDIRFRYPDGSIFTPMEPARFEVFETVGDTEGFNWTVSDGEDEADSDAGQGGEAGG